MLKPTDQKQVQKRINDFMASKSPWKQFSKTVAEHMAPSARLRKEARSDISYEPLDWNHGPVARTSYRKLAS